MTRVYSSIYIDRPLEEVFCFVTTPSNWPLWHIQTHQVSCVEDESSSVGSEIFGEVKLMGKNDRFKWTVRESKPHSRWVFEGIGDGGARAQVIYTFTPQGQGTLFERELSYKMGNPFTNFLDKLYLRNRVSEISEDALLRLKQILEAPVRQLVNS